MANTFPKEPQTRSVLLWGLNAYTPHGEQELEDELIEVIIRKLALQSKHLLQLSCTFCLNDMQAVPTTATARKIIFLFCQRAMSWNWHHQ